jgi:hypothetical protein
LIDGHGKFLIPGLWDMHVHIWDPDLAFPLFLANGVTGVRNTGGNPENLKRWRRALAEGKRVGPHLVACGPLVDGPPPIHPDHSVVVHSAAQARSTADELKSQAWDCIKVYDNLPREAYFALADESKKDHIPLVGHVPVAVTAIEASDAGQRSIEHLEGLDYAISPAGERLRQDRLQRIGRPQEPGEMMKMPLRTAAELTQLADTYDETRAAELFSHFTRNGTWQVPTLSVKKVYASIGSAAMYQDPHLKYVGTQERDAWEHNPIVHIDMPDYLNARRQAFEESKRITRSAHKAGVRVLAGTDSGGVPYLYYGFSLHDELALLVESGFTNMQALQAATRDSTEFLGLEDRGTIQPGKRADVVLLGADPLADIHNTRQIEIVVANGWIFDPASIRALLDEAESEAKK